ncbi:MAG: ParB N-terminal domain-containing protein [Oscillospiraceae bacterium]|nr:ParB N-terminal domain-containing protein [Oscillospiraceae bacterium]
MRENIRLVWRKIDELIPYEHNSKLHPQEQLDKLVGSFDEFGRIVPAGIDRDGNLIYGHGRILAARQRGDTDFPCIEIDGLSETQRRAFVHADNLLAQSGTDEEILRAEMQALQAAGFDVSITGFDPAGLKIGTEAELEKITEDDYDEEPPEEPRTKRGQIWQLGDHRLMCGDATSAEDMQLCFGGAETRRCLYGPALRRLYRIA